MASDWWDGLPQRLGWEEMIRTLPPSSLLEIVDHVRREAQAGHTGRGTYLPVVPAFHGPFKEWTEGRCGTCGLKEEHHEGWEDRKALVEEFQRFDRWELLLVIQHLRSR